jgi:hypothetical protein
MWLMRVQEKQFGNSSQQFFEKNTPNYVSVSNERMRTNQ